MKQRCNKPNLPSAPWYYDKGIKVCDEWLIYSNFEKWALNNGYSDNLTIDRIDSNGNYEPNNCQWITRADNTKKSHIGRSRGLIRRNKYGRFMVVRIKKRKRFATVRKQKENRNIINKEVRIWAKKKKEIFLIQSKF